jgi:hypothetical protein
MSSSAIGTVSITTMVVPSAFTLIMSESNKGQIEFIENGYRRHDSLSSFAHFEYLW